MEKKTHELIEKMEKIPNWEQLPEKSINWNEAINMAMQRNLDIRRGKEAVLNAERSVDRIFLDMIPGVNLDAMITKDIENIFNVSGGDVDYNANILFNFPSLTKVPIQYYTAQASVFRAKKSFELKQREIASKIYKSAMEYSISMQTYQLQKKNIPMRDDGRETNRIEQEWHEKKQRLLSEMSVLVGNMDKKWSVRPNTVPRLDWNKYKRVSSKLDFLVMTTMAMEIEASRLNIFGIRMQYFPELNVNFYSPSLFSSTAGTQTGIYASSGDIKVNMNLSWRLDTQLRVWYQLKSAKAEHQFLQEEIRMRVIERKEKVRTLLKSRTEFEEWHSYMLKRVDFLTKRTALDADDYKKTQAEIDEITKELYTQSMRNVEVEAALILEYGFL